MSKKKNRVLVIDALNMYFRAYIVDPSLSTNGQPIGGLKGFLKILNKLCREMKPDEIVICWDGPGGSKKRKLVNKNYKEGRKPIRLNRDIRNLSETEEFANKVWQQTKLFEYLNCMPIIQLMADSVEADDIISYVCTHPQFKGKQKVIVSSDKDFFQLLDNETVLYRPVQKEFLNKGRLVEKFGIHPTNFALARAVTGDKSDNLAGIPGVGLQTVSKRFPFFADKMDCTVEDLVEHCSKVEEPLKVHTRIVENVPRIKENYKLMQLYAPLIPVQTKQKINFAIDNFEPEFNKTSVRAMFIEDGIGEIYIDSLFQTFRKIVVENNKR